jgi:hypothetical protein
MVLKDSENKELDTILEPFCKKVAKSDVYKANKHHHQEVMEIDLSSDDEF